MDGVGTRSMTEIIESTEVCSQPSRDITALRRRYVPVPDEIVTWDEFVQRGAEVVQLARDCFMLLGELVEEGWQRFGSPQGRRHFAGMCADAWGCSRASVTKAWVLHGANLELPQDAPPTLAYEIVSGEDDPESAEEALDRAVAEGWRVQDAREVKALRSQGLVDAWQRVHLSMRADGTLMARNDGEWVAIGELDVGSSEILVLAGIKLLRMRARV